mmetsp:Transcript_16631/g.32211  ORF Transcript_16631/g.32211 Transcript_16631/m.32211 type:complete len:621 (-) Transcript_16631:109-1971(-)
MEGLLEVPKSGRWRPGYARYFVVDFERKAVCSGKDEAQAKGDAAKKLPGYNFAAVELTGSVPGEFHVLTRKRTYVFRAASAREARRWVRAVQTLMQDLAGLSDHVRTASGGTKSLSSERNGMLILGSIFATICFTLIYLTALISPRSPSLIRPTPSSSSSAQEDNLSNDYAALNDLPLKQDGGNSNSGGGLLLVLILLGLGCTTALFKDKIYEYFDTEMQRIRCAMEDTYRETLESWRTPYDEFIQSWFGAYDEVKSSGRQYFNTFCASLPHFLLAENSEKEEDSEPAKRRSRRSQRSFASKIDIGPRALGPDQRRSFERRLMAHHNSSAAMNLTRSSSAPEGLSENSGSRQSFRREPRRLVFDNERTNALQSMLASRSATSSASSFASSNSETHSTLSLQEDFDDLENEDSPIESEVSPAKGRSAKLKKSKSFRSWWGRKRQGSQSKLTAAAPIVTEIDPEPVPGHNKRSRQPPPLPKRKSSAKRYSRRPFETSESALCSEADEETKDDDLTLNEGTTPASRMENAGPEYAKYAKMLRNGVPEGAVRNALARDDVTEPYGVFEDDGLYSHSKATKMQQHINHAKQNKSNAPRRSLRQEPSMIDELRRRQLTLGIVPVEE